MRCAALMLVTFYVLPGAFPASAQTYPPTIAGLRALVTDDAAMLPPPYAAQLRKQEADWEKGVSVTCVPTGSKQRYCYPEAKTVIQTIQSHIFKMDGYVFDGEDWSTSVQMSPTALEHVGGASTAISLDQDIPQIVAPLDAKSRAFNAAVKSYLLFLWMQLGGPPRTNPQADQCCDFELDYAPNTDALPGVISLSITLDNYTHGAVHGEGKMEDFNWSLTLNRHIIPADLFRPDTNWQLGVATAGVVAFAGVPQYSENLRTPENMEQLFSDPRSWALLRSGLKIDTGSYEVCPYMCGAPAATIPWSSLKSYLKPGGLVHNS
jgi:hypothetical protein